MKLPNRTAILHILARMVLFWETLWPPLLPILCVLGLFVAVALLEIPALLPGWSHVALLVLSGWAADNGGGCPPAPSRGAWSAIVA
jgi:hypothetical protein